MVLSIGLGEGTKSSVSSEIDALGSNLLIVSPGSVTSAAGVRSGIGSAATLTIADAQALRSSTAAPDVGAVAPTQSSSLEIDNGSTNWTSSVVGSTPSWLTVRSREISAGRFITARDDRNAATDIVLGPETAKELFGSGFDPVGQTVTIDGIAFTVVGVLKSAGSDSSSNLDDTGPRGRSLHHDAKLLGCGPAPSPPRPAKSNSYRHVCSFVCKLMSKASHA